MVIAVIAVIVRVATGEETRVARKAVPQEILTLHCEYSLSPTESILG